jgi:hypothetical protein
MVIGPIGASRSSERKAAGLKKLPLPYGSSPCPRGPALSSAYSSRYLAFRLPSRMPAQGLWPPRVMSGCILDRSAAYPGGRSLGATCSRLSRTFEPEPLLDVQCTQP